jgi:hypothetical protein
MPSQHVAQAQRRRYNCHAVRHGSTRDRAMAGRRAPDDVARLLIRSSARCTLWQVTRGHPASRHTTRRSFNCLMSCSGSAAARPPGPASTSIPAAPRTTSGAMGLTGTKCARHALLSVPLRRPAGDPPARFPVGGTANLQLHPADFDALRSKDDSDRAAWTGVSSRLTCSPPCGTLDRGDSLVHFSGRGLDSDPMNDVEHGPHVVEAK